MNHVVRLGRSDKEVIIEVRRFRNSLQPKFRDFYEFKSFRGMILKVIRLAGGATFQHRRRLKDSKIKF